MGYHRAGFADIVGVDLADQPRYPIDFIQGDALQVLSALGDGGCMKVATRSGRWFELADFDAIHASPPCQHASDLRYFHPGRDYPDLIQPTRDALLSTGKHYVIENVEGASLIEPITLCGSMFGLGAQCNDGKWHQLRRHRRFECSFYFLVRPCHHKGKPIGVYGNGGGNKARVEAGLVNGMTGTAQERRDAMGIDWMTREELSQAIPPVYTEYIGRYLLAVLEDRG